ncbi:MAG: aminotransferase class I/II-fold pyridoxal phosphate-dependent enzyme [Mesorhizobium sp.]|uniref:trans-sulfuration enzyme family protein n=1 Tax=Mesorhizobium sp. TaxID=1871066 RepID=UPI0012100162|nr:aminotransferase class I/II-fold pyridoxal phosphate-dependent enzyme [Mesorhizobium sp.]TIN04024.1 MAG: aminotransferase class I/II-fold pyridoxal phosphate-dependent enzyme [Mesorhizobium sp.]
MTIGGSSPCERNRGNSAKYGLETLALHAGLNTDPDTRAIGPNISMSVNHLVVPGEGNFSASANNDLTALPFLYSRWTNPTVRQLEKRVAALEGTDDSVATATGIAAIAATYFSLLNSGDHLIISDVSYPGANELARRQLPRFGIETTPVNLSRIDHLKAAIRPNTKIILAEVPCNPILRLIDLAAVSEVARNHGIMLVVDSTIATPVATRPISFGADLVIHSLTKYMNGHGDALGGIVSGRKELVERIRKSGGVYLGATLSAHNAWLILRGIDTLFPRVTMMSNTALRVAEYLSEHQKVLAVTYPGLKSHPQHELAKRQMDVFGGMISFQTADLANMCIQLSKRLQVIHYSVSLGHQRSLICSLATDEINESTWQMHGAELKEYKKWAGDGLFRLSIGLEAPEDIIADLDQALST